MDVVRRQHGFGIPLADAVVGDGNGPVTHTVGQPHDLARVAETVHRAGFGVQVQFHPLLPVRRRILAGHPLHLQHIVGQQDIVPLILVVGIVAPHNQGRAGFEALPLGHVLAVIPQDLEVDGTVVVGDGGEIDLAAVALDLGGEHVAPDRDLAAVAQIVERAQVRRLEGFAVEQLGRLAGKFQPVDGEGRDLLLGLELHRRRLFRHPAFHGLGVQLDPHVLHPHDGQRPGAFLDPLRQVAGKFDAFQDRAPRVHPNGQAVRLEHHRLLLVQKAVDRHSFLLEFLNQQAHRFGGDGIVVEVVFQLQFIPGKQRVQRSQKAPAQRRVQRVGTAQADDDLAGGTEQFHPFHHHPAKGCIELCVGRELRPDLCHKRFQGFSFAWSFRVCRSRRSAGPQCGP